MSFPSNPYLGQLHISDHTLWRWSGERWDSLSSDLSDFESYACEEDEPVSHSNNNNSGGNNNAGNDVPSILLRIETRLAAIEAKLTNGFLLID